MRVYQNGAGGGYQGNSLTSAVSQTSLTSFVGEHFSTMTAGPDHDSYDSSASATVPTTLVSFYSKGLSTLASEAAVSVVTTTLIITTTEVIPLPVTMTGARSYGPYDPSAATIASTTLFAFYNKRLPLMAPELSLALDATTSTMTLPMTRTGGENYHPHNPSATSTKPTGTTIGGTNYGPYDPAATSTKPTGTKIGGVTNYTTVQTYRTSSKTTATQSSTAS